MSRAEAGTASLYHRVVVYLLFLILVLPLVGTLSTRFPAVGRQPSCLPASA